VEPYKVSAMDTAPDFTDGYPSKGKMIGPAWQAMWDAMADHEWHPRADIAEVGVNATGIVPKTAVNLLVAATKAKVIHTRGADGRKDHFAPREVARGGPLQSAHDLFSGVVPL